MLITKCGVFFRDKNEGETSQRTVQLFTFLEQLKDSNMTIVWNQEKISPKKC